MHIIVGLGNPGSEYEGTRHNVGFQVIDRLASMVRVKFRNLTGYQEAAVRLANQSAVLIKPQTYMNNSGEALSDVLERYGGSPDEILVCCDDFHLPLGKLRLRKKGGDGGHNGLASVIHQLGTEDFARLRCGIAGESIPGPGEDMADYVLSPFTEKENALLGEFVADAAACITAVVRDGIDRAMNRFHQQHR